MTVVYRLDLAHSSDVSSVGDRLRSVALRVGFSDLSASTIGLLGRNLASELEPGSRALIGLRSDFSPSCLTLKFSGQLDTEAIKSQAARWAQNTTIGDGEVELHFELPDPTFSPDSAWLRDTQVWLAEQTQEELQHELKRTNDELKVVLEHLRRQARHEARKAEALKDANLELEEKHAQEFRLARFDPISQLPSRIQFEHSLAEQIIQSQAKKRRFALLFIDLDFFKEINDCFGHAAGDQTLSIVGQRMSSTLRDSDLVGRLGGDEFGVILPHLGQPSDAGKVASLLIAAIREPIDLECGTGQLDGSVGIAIFPDDGSDAESLIAGADQAMYRVKRSGRGNFAFNARPPDSAMFQHDDPAVHIDNSAKPSLR